jgi:hypothetical protein
MQSILLLANVKKFSLSSISTAELEQLLQSLWIIFATFTALRLQITKQFEMHLKIYKNNNKKQIYFLSEFVLTVVLTAFTQAWRFRRCAVASSRWSAKPLSGQTGPWRPTAAGGWGGGREHERLSGRRKEKAGPVLICWSTNKATTSKQTELR